MSTDLILNESMIREMLQGAKIKEDIEVIIAFLLKHDLVYNDIVINIIESISMPESGFHALKERILIVYNDIGPPKIHVFDLPCCDELEVNYLNVIKVLMREISGVKFPDRPCSKCGNIEFFTVAKQIGAGDEGMDYFRTCQSCNATFRD